LYDDIGEGAGPRRNKERKGVAPVSTVPGQVHGKGRRQEGGNFKEKFWRA